MSSLSQPLSRALAVAAAVAVAATALTACTGPAADPDATSERAGTLNLAMSRDPGSWDPALLIGAFDELWRYSAVYDTLLTCNPDGTVGPGAAEDYEFTDDHTVLTAHLREGLTFEDGTAIDSAAVKASIEHQQTVPGPAQGRVAGLEIATPDDLTIVITSPRPRGLLPVFMCQSTGIIASPAALASETLASVPVSSGPYVLDAARTTSGSVYTYTKRDEYWNADSFPYEELVITVIVDPTARLNALKTGQADVAVVAPETVDEAEASGLNILETVDAINGVLLFDRDGAIVPALGDERVRQAINMVFDREAIAEGLYQGRVQPTEQFFNPNSGAYSEDLEGTYPFDVEAAKDLMAEAGYADGFTLELPSRTPVTDQANPLIVQQLGLIGITVTEVPLSGPTAIPEILSGRFPMAYIGMPTSSGLNDTEQSISPRSPWNVLHNEDPELNALIERAQSASGDDLEEALQSINEFVVESAWFAPWNYRVAYLASVDSVTLQAGSDFYLKVPRLQDFD